MTFKLTESGDGFKELTLKTADLQKVLESAAKESAKLREPVFNAAAWAATFDSISNSVRQLQSACKSLTDAYAVQKQAETQLETVMRQRMNATDEQIQSIKDLCSAQQQLGVIGDEVQLAGAQQIATFLTQKRNLELLIPAMNNLLAQQKGLNATGQDAVTIGNLIGKAMQGQSSALRRVGITFDEAQEKVLKFGTESERAAMVAEIITANVGEMNRALAQTDIGKQKQFENSLGDLKEKIGSVLQNVQPYLTFAASMTTGTTGVLKLTTALKACSAVKAANAVASGLASKAVSALGVAMTAGSVGAKALAWSIKSLMIATGVGIAIAALTTIIGFFVGKSDEASESVNKLMTAEELAKKTTEDFTEANRNAGQLYGEQKGKIESLIRVAENETLSLNRRQKAVNELNQIIPDYNAHIDESTKKYKASTDALNNYLKSLEKEMRYKAHQDKLQELINEAETKRFEADDAIENASEVREREFHNLSDWGREQWRRGKRVTNHAMRKADAEAAEKKKAADQADAAVQAYRDKMEKAASAGLLSIPKGTESPNTTPASSSSGGNNNSKPEKKFNENATTLQGIRDNIDVLQKQLNGATADTAAAINKNIAKWQEMEKAIVDAGKAATDLPKTLSDINWEAKSPKELSENIAILNELLDNTTNIDTAEAINEYKKDFENAAAAIRNAGTATKDLHKEATKAEPTYNAAARTIAQMEENVSYLNNELLKAQSLQEAEKINKNIAVWQKQIDAYRDAGKSSTSAFASIRTGWSSIQGVESGIRGITDALEGNGTIWEKLSAIISGTLSVFEGILSLMQLLTPATEALTTAKTAEAVATGTNATVKSAEATAASAETGAVVADSAAKKINTAITNENTTAAAANIGVKSGEAIAAATASGAMLPFPANLAAISAGVSAVLSAMATAMGVAAVGGALATAGKFAQGGIVGGTSPTGDKLLARVNSGEMILNMTQQRRLYNALAGNGDLGLHARRSIDSRSKGYNLAAADFAKLYAMRRPEVDFKNARFEIEGRKLVAVLEKENNLKRRN